jgi:hypothetical protein
MVIKVFKMLRIQIWILTLVDKTAMGCSWLKKFKDMLLERSTLSTEQEISFVKHYYQVIVVIKFNYFVRFNWLYMDLFFK